MKAFQLKITIKYSRPPIWRRVLVHQDATFWDLHSVIQDVFGWEDYHLHSFEKTAKRDEDRHYFEILRKDDLRQLKAEIGEQMFGLPFPKSHYHDELKEKLSDWITYATPAFKYTYDFGDNWEHDIKLEKIIDVDKFELAKYLGGKRKAVEEDSRSESVLDCTTIIKAADDADGKLWQEVIQDIGAHSAKKLLDTARAEAVSLAPDTVQFTSSKERLNYSRRFMR